MTREEDFEELDFVQPHKIVGKLISVDVLDKIRAEIEEKADGSVGEIADGLYDALEIIDKYKAETEPQAGSNECIISDYPDMPYQYDNMTGSMNL